MSDVYILKNQYDLFLDKHGEWVDQADPSVLYRTVHRDEAINVKVEHTVKHPDLRIQVQACALNERGQLVLQAVSPKTDTIDSMLGETFESDRENVVPIDAASRSMAGES